MIIPETGAGLTDANSYTSVAEALTFHADRGNTAWASASTDDQATALVRATDYVEGTYKAKEGPLEPLQALQWPTCNATAFTLAKRATMILALQALNGPIVPLEAVREAIITKEALTGVGSIETTIDPQISGDRYPLITAMLSPIASRRGCGVGFGRVTRERYS